LSLTHTLSNHSLTPSLPIFFFILPPPPRSTLFPYTTLFRSELQPHQRREPGLRDRVRRRPYLPDGPGADGQRAHRVRRGRDGRRDPPAAVAGRPVRRHRGRRGRKAYPVVPRETEGPGGTSRLARRGVRVDGQLRVHHAGA